MHTYHEFFRPTMMVLRDIKRPLSRCDGIQPIKSIEAYRCLKEFRVTDKIIFRSRPSVARRTRIKPSLSIVKSAQVGTFAICDRLVNFKFRMTMWP